MLNFFNGTATAMITPFAKDGSVNFDAFGRMIEYQIENGTDVLVILGTTGEPATLTEAEKETLYCYMNGMNQSEAAFALGITIFGVKYRKLRIRYKYRTYIGEF